MPLTMHMIHPRVSLSIPDASMLEAVSDNGVTDVVLLWCNRTELVKEVQRAVAGYERRI